MRPLDRIAVGLMLLGANPIGFLFLLLILPFAVSIGLAWGLAKLLSHLSNSQQPTHPQRLIEVPVNVAVPPEHEGPIRW
jgi:hypothetical protein